MQTLILKKRKQKILGFLSPVFCLLPLLLWWTPTPNSIDPQAWKVFSVFLFTLVGLITKPVPAGVITLLGITILVVKRVLSFQEAFMGFSHPTVWLIGFAFFIARALIHSGLGMRMAYRFLSLFGKNALGIAYGLSLTDWLLASSIPSVTARSGGVLFPLIQSISEAFQSYPEKGRKKIGSYLILTLFHSGVITSALFLTAMSGNPLIQTMASHLNIIITWNMWMKAAIVPGLITLLLVPYLLYKIYPPEEKDCASVRLFANDQLRKMGPMTMREKWVILSFCLMITLWSMPHYFHIDATTAALMGLLLLVLTGTISWDDILKEKGAWDTIIWFATLIAIASALNKYGFMSVVSSFAEKSLKSHSWHIAFPLLVVFYYYSHYGFASSLAHITSMYMPFLVLAISLGTPPLLAAYVLGFSSNLFGGLTPYSSGPAPIYFGAGFVTPEEWWKWGFIISLLHFIIWGVIGGVWWYYLGLYKMV